MKKRPTKKFKTPKYPTGGETQYLQSQANPYLKKEGLSARDVYWQRLEQDTKTGQNTVKYYQANVPYKQGQPINNQGNSAISGAYEIPETAFYKYANKDNVLYGNISGGILKTTAEQPFYGREEILKQYPNAQFGTAQTTPTFARGGKKLPKYQYGSTFDYSQLMNMGANSLASQIPAGNNQYGEEQAIGNSNQQLGDQVVGQIPGFGQMYGALNKGQQSIADNQLGDYKYVNGRRQYDTATGNAAYGVITPTHKQQIESATNLFKSGNDKQDAKMAFVDIGMGGGASSMIYRGINSGGAIDTAEQQAKNKILSLDRGAWMNKKNWAMGGMNMQPNAELEKQEVMQLPNGTTEQVDGPSHQNGGVDVNIPNGTKIFSDRLKSVTGKTFAKEAAKYKTDKEEKVLSNNPDRLKRITAQLMLDAKNRKLNEIFAEQEQLKANKVAKYAEKMGCGGMFKNKMPNGGFYDYDGFATKFPLGGMQKDDPFYGEDTELNIDPSMQNFLARTGGVDNTFNETTSTPKGKSNDIYKTVGKEALNFGMQNVGNLAYLIDQGKRYDKVDYGRVSPKHVDYSEQINDINLADRIAAKNLASASGGNAGVYLSNRGAVGMAGARAKASIRQSQANTNAQIDNQFGMFNKNVDIQSMRDEAANKGQALTNYYTALGAIGQNTAGQTRDYRLNKMDNLKLGLIKQYYPDYEFSPKTFEWTYRQALEQQKQK